MTPEDIKNITDPIGRAFEEFKSANDKRLAEIEKKGTADVVTTEKVDRINTSMTDMQEKFDAMGKEFKALEKRMARPVGEGAGEDPAAAEERKNFLQILRKGANGQTQIQFEHKDMSISGGDNQGGYYVPPTFAARIVERVFETTDFRPLATTMVTSGDDIEFLNNTTDIAGGWVGELDTRSKTAGTQPGKVRIPTREMEAMPAVSQKLLDDAYFDLEGYIVNKIADKFARLENAAFINGTGSTQPTGILNYSAVATADGTRAWGKLQYVATGASGAFLAAASSPGDCLNSVVYALKTAYLNGASWLAGRDSLNLIRSLKNSVGGYLWQPSFQLGQPSTLLDYPVTIAPDMPAVAANSLSVAFGNFKRGYTILDRIGMRLLRDPYSAKPEVEFYATKRTGGDVTDFEAIKLLKFSVS